MISKWTKVSMLVFSLLSVNSAYAERVGTPANGICTRDFNLWGHPSKCNCPEAVYSPEAGYCLSGEQENVTVQGELFNESPSSILLRTEEGVEYHLIFARNNRPSIGEARWLRYQVTGELIKVQGDDDRQTIVVSDWHLTF